MSGPLLRVAATAEKCHGGYLPLQTMNPNCSGDSHLPRAGCVVCQSKKVPLSKGLVKLAPFFYVTTVKTYNAERRSLFHQLVADVLGVHTCRTLPVPVGLIDSVALCPLLLFSANRM